MGKNLLSQGRPSHTGIEVSSDTRGALWAGLTSSFQPCDSLLELSLWWWEGPSLPCGGGLQVLGITGPQEQPSTSDSWEVVNSSQLSLLSHVLRWLPSVPDRVQPHWWYHARQDSFHWLLSLLCLTSFFPFLCCLGYPPK